MRVCEGVAVTCYWTFKDLRIICYLLTDCILHKLCTLQSVLVLCYAGEGEC